MEQKIKNHNYIYIFILLIIFVLYITLSWASWNNPYYDTFREVMLPLKILEGQIPYKDFNCLYSPLAYQLNALFYFLFGNSLKTLYFAGIFNAFIILSCSYYIVFKLTNHHFAFLSVLLMMCLGMFSHSMVMHWFLPYSYAIIYAFTCLLLSIIFILRYWKTKSDKSLYMSSLFMGLSLAFKLDFMFFELILLFFIFKNFSVKRLLYNILLFILPIVSVFIFLFIQGLTIQDFIVQINLWQNFQSSPTLKEFNLRYYPSFFDIFREDYFLVPRLMNAMHVLFTAFLIIICALPFSILNVLLLRRKNIAVALISAIAYILILKYAPVFEILNYNLIFYYITIFELLFLILKYLKTHCLSRNEKYFLFLVITGILVNYRVIFNLAPGLTYDMTFIIFVMAAMVFSFGLLLRQKTNVWQPPSQTLPLEGGGQGGGEKNNHKLIAVVIINKAKNIMFIFQNTIIIFCLVVSCVYFMFANSKENVIFQCENGIYKSRKPEADIFSHSIDYVRKNIPLNAKLLVIPEGEIVNYFTGHDLNGKYYSLIPHMIDMYGEDYIINDLLNNKENMPDYIMIYSAGFPGAGSFGRGYGEKLYKEITKKYQLIYVINDEMSVYRRL